MSLAPGRFGSLWKGSTDTGDLLCSPWRPAGVGVSNLEVVILAMGGALKSHAPQEAL